MLWEREKDRQKEREKEIHNQRRDKRKRQRETREDHHLVKWRSQKLSGGKSSFPSREGLLLNQEELDESGITGR